MIESHIPALIAITFVLFAILIPALGLWKDRLAQPLAVLGSGIAVFFSFTGFLNFLSDGSRT